MRHVSLVFFKQREYYALDPFWNTEPTPSAMHLSKVFITPPFMAETSNQFCVFGFSHDYGECHIFFRAKARLLFSVTTPR